MLLVSRKGVVYQRSRTQGVEGEFDARFSRAALELKYTGVLRSRGGRGIDHIGVDAFDRQKDVQLDIAARKCHDGSYMFAPYLERLVTRGATRPPRVISVPTLRDRVVLAQLKSFLDGPCADCVERRLANEFVRNLMKFAASTDVTALGVIRADISSFFDSIDQHALLERLRKRVQSDRALALTKRAIQGTTSDAFTRRCDRSTHRNRKGIPQGLAISGLLASLYLEEFDETLRSKTLLYMRYVDDLVMLFPLERLDEISKLLREKMEILGLTLNSRKYYEGPASEPFEYLSYSLRLPHASVREANVEKFLRAVSARFAAYRHLTDKGQHPPWMSPEKRRQAFVQDLNDKITGAVSETRRYGWLAYFLEIDDFALLHRADKIVATFFDRLPEFTKEDLASLKRLSRAYYEMKFSPNRGYIQNFNRIVNTADRIRYLALRGRLDPNEASRMTDDQVFQRFEQERIRLLRELEVDEGFLY